ncbi:glycosyltransferase family 2 protein [Desulfuromonas sp. AOP6]|uniref:glycosyltransferase n=1 Tax=Desulfuromonas sp. AOP6 TaxID=1566351 RepID=UPI00127F2995|nr:glycosyltransferase family 2 protein [Desulfuromonas sp. AOP6]BCA80602.1 glycosyl hydrolase [Desulfuromonas sp. AOP6]
MNILFWLGLVTLLIITPAAVIAYTGSRRLTFLREVVPALSVKPPKVSVVIAARNEQRHIRQALQSILQLDYPDYEVIVVNDRSEDATGAILQEMSASEERLRLLTIDELPAGWLGKNHALWRGSALAGGDLLLFTDADVVMEPSTLARAVALLEGENLDHQAATPVPHMPTHFLNIFGATFGLIFGMYVRPWKVRDPKSRCHIGIGAFNLVRTTAYREVGGHRTIALRPDDDLKLGKIIKKGGFSQDIAYGTDLISVEWYASVGEVIRGLEKNVFAGTDYRLSLIIAGALFHLAVSVWPYAALLLTTGTTRLLYAAIVAVLTFSLIDGARFHGYRRWYAAGYPLAAALFAYILLRSVTLNLLHGGITWRGTFYSLAELRQNRV